MSNPMAGWYPDPSGDLSKLRYWDGSSWTEHFAPAHSAAAGGEVSGTDAGGSSGGTQEPLSQVPGDDVQSTEQLPTRGGGATAATGQFPAHEGAQAQPTEQFPVTQGQQPYGYQSAYGQQAPGQPYGHQQPYAQYPGSAQPYGHSPYAASSGQRDGQQPAKDADGSGRGAVIGIVVAAVVLAAVVITAVVLLLGGGEEPAPQPAPMSAPTQESTTQAPARNDPTAEAGAALDGGNLELDATVAGAIAPGDTWTATLNVAEATPVAIDVVAGTGDLTLSLSGNSIELSNDDRGEFMKTGEASSLDPALAAYLEPGEYEVTVSSYSGFADADFTVTATVPEIVPAEGTISIESGPDEGWLAAIELEEPTTLVFDAVSAEDGDPVLGIYTSTGSNEGADDSDEGAGSSTDPYLELKLPAGLHFISLGDYWGDPLTSELTITAQ